MGPARHGPGQATGVAHRAHRVRRGSYAPVATRQPRFVANRSCGSSDRRNCAPRRRTRATGCRRARTACGCPPGRSASVSGRRVGREKTAAALPLIAPRWLAPWPQSAPGRHCFAPAAPGEPPVFAGAPPADFEARSAAAAGALAPAEPAPVDPRACQGRPRAPAPRKPGAAAPQGRSLPDGLFRRRSRRARHAGLAPWSEGRAAERRGYALRSLLLLFLLYLALPLVA